MNEVRMKFQEFIDKFKSRYLWLNLLAMALVVAALVLGVKKALDIYTHHGIYVSVPDIEHKRMTEARRMLYEAGLEVEVTDTGYVKELPADCVLEQKPGAGSQVKEGHKVSVTVNASSTPTLSLPDVIQNSSLREATAKLAAMGFKLGPTQLVDGEKDWVYGITVDGHHVAAGDRIPVSKTIVIHAGNGLMSIEDSVIYVDAQQEQGYDYGTEDYGNDVDDFVEVE